MQFTDENIKKDSRAAQTKDAMKKAGVFFLLLMVCQIPVAYVIYGLQLVFPEKYSTLVSIVTTQGYLLVAALIYMPVTGNRFGRDLQVKKFRISTFFLSLLVLITASPMASVLNVLSQLFVSNEVSNAVFDITKSVPAWLGILVIGCLPGFIEETIYRGILFTAFRKRSVLTGIVISALSFGLMHGNFNQIPYAIYLGVIFALLVEATGSLVSTMILHMLFNAVNTAYIYIMPKFYEWMGQYATEYAEVDIEAAMEQTVEKSQLLWMAGSMLPLALSGLVLTFLLLRAIAKRNGRTFTLASIKGEKEVVSAVKPVNRYLVIGWIFCILIAIGNMLE